MEIVNFLLQKGANIGDIRKLFLAACQVCNLLFCFVLFLVLVLNFCFLLFMISKIRKILFDDSIDWLFCFREAIWKL